MKNWRLIWFGLLAAVVAGAGEQAAFAQAAPPCVVAVMSGGGGLELPQLHSTLTALGVTYVDVASLAEAQGANASVIIDRYDGTNLSTGDISTWLAAGRGYIQLGDWPHGFANAWVELPNGQPVPVTVADASSPLAAGLASSWTARGFWAYDWSSDALGFATDTSLPDVLHGTYNGTTYTRVATTQVVGAGRAVYIGINVYGSLAGPNELTLLSNALSWAGACSVQPVEPIPALGGIGLAILALALAVLGVALIRRLS